MVRRFIAIFTALLVTAAASHLWAHGGLELGSPLGAFRVTKVAGAADDGVPTDETLCYRCRFGSKPMVLAFVRSESVDLKPMVDELNGLLDRHEGDKLRGLIAFYGDEAEPLRKRAEMLAKSVSTSEAPIVVTKDAKTGPTNYSLPADHDVTIVTAIDSQVVSVEHFDGSVDMKKVSKAIEQAIAES